MPDPNALLNAALAYQAIGFSVIPVKPNKTPYVQWTKFQTTRATPEEITAWWAKWPKASVAVVTGQVSSMVAVDIDSAIGQEAYKAQFGEIHGTCRQTTGKPGAMHLCFKPPAGVKLANSSRSLPDVDTRGDGGYIVVSPSIHSSGTVYTWVVDPVDSPDDLMDLPKAVQEWFWPASKEAAADKKERLDVQNLLLGVQKGQRNDICARLAGYYLRLTKGDIGQTKAILGAWNDRNQPPLEWKEVERTVDSISKRQGQEELSEALGGSLISKIDILSYPDGTAKYHVFFDGFEGYSELEPEDFTMQQKFIKKYLVITRILLVPMKPKVWASLVTEALKEASVIQVEAEETLLGAVMGIIDSEVREDRKCEDLSLVDNHVISINGSAFFSFQHIQNSLQFSNFKISNNQLGSLLRRLGCRKKKEFVGSDQKRFWEMELKK